MMDNGLSFTKCAKVHNPKLQAKYGCYYHSHSYPTSCKRPPRYFTVPACTYTHTRSHTHTLTRSHAHRFEARRAKLKDPRAPTHFVFHGSRSATEIIVRTQYVVVCAVPLPLMWCVEQCQVCSLTSLARMSVCVCAGLNGLGGLWKQIQDHGRFTHCQLTVTAPTDIQALFARGCWLYG